mmetsp:Transcript_26803/g.65014  ORF Transcript_26803/g.65014 Transcript_26803/m.65014 type:complete len:123 (+) Transcript_26803:112-480(+)
MKQLRCMNRISAWHTPIDDGSTSREHTQGAQVTFAILWLLKSSSQLVSLTLGHLPLHQSMIGSILFQQNRLALCNENTLSNDVSTFRNWAQMCKLQVYLHLTTNYESEVPSKARHLLQNIPP